MQRYPVLPEQLVGKVAGDAERVDEEEAGRNPHDDDMLRTRAVDGEAAE